MPLPTQIALRRIPLAGKSAFAPAFFTHRFNSTKVPATPTSREIAEQQAPNRDVTWTKTQRPRSDVIDDPRFVRADLQTQPRPMAAIELIAEEPVREIDGRLACCDGGSGALGHPRVWINLDDGSSESCGYCGLRFKMKPHHH
ncbi:hypothetical protein GGI11_007262 [Coemansia sp. RSA 2049]|nr:hypothetical protein GGI11_007262 [Coemansia sp. RSA 2049]